jgi:hypothetical protein
MINPQYEEEIDLLEKSDKFKPYEHLKGLYDDELDVYAELIQNAVKAIEESGRQRGKKVEVIVDLIKKRIVVHDNGVGMDKERLEYFSYGRTTRPGKSETGLGIGASYVIALSDFFSVETVKDNQQLYGLIENAREQIFDKKESLKLRVTKPRNVQSPNYTKIEVGGKYFEDMGCFELASIDEFIKKLRRYTAVGYTKTLFGKSLNISCTVKLIKSDENGHPYTEEKSFDASYDFLAEDDPSVIKYEDVLSADDCSNKFLRYIDEKKEIYALAGKRELFATNRIEPGIYISINGYPQNMRIPPEIKGEAGYWPNVLILINKDDISVDPGRKRPSGGDANKITRTANEVYSKVTKYIGKFTAEPAVSTGRSIGVQIYRQTVRNLPELGIADINFVKEPQEEQGVIAIFYELVGKGILKNYKTLKISSGDVYDAVMRYEAKWEEVGDKQKTAIQRSIPKEAIKMGFVKELQVEFKKDTQKLISDFGGPNPTKDLKDVDIIIVWELKTPLEKGWQLFSFKDDPQLKIYKGTTHILKDPYMGEAHLMVLKTLLEETFKKGV